jgi:hypothetical protein
MLFQRGVLVVSPVAVVARRGVKMVLRGQGGRTRLIRDGDSERRLWRAGSRIAP